MTTTHPWVRLLLTGTLIATLPLTGCTLGDNNQTQKGQEEQAQKQLNTNERKRIEKELSALEHVTSCGAGYTNTWPEKGTASVSVSLPIAYQDENTKNRIYDRAIKVVWLSRLDPLDTITVRIVWLNPEGRSPVDETTPLLGDKGRAELTQRYGPRPS